MAVRTGLRDLGDRRGLDVDVHVAVGAVGRGHGGEDVVRDRAEDERVGVERPGVLVRIELGHAPHEARLPADHVPVVDVEADDALGHARRLDPLGQLREVGELLLILAIGAR